MQRSECTANVPLVSTVQSVPSIIIFPHSHQGGGAVGFGGGAASCRTFCLHVALQGLRQSPDISNGPRQSCRSCRSLVASPLLFHQQQHHQFSCGTDGCPRRSVAVPQQKTRNSRRGKHEEHEVGTIRGRGAGGDMRDRRDDGTGQGRTPTEHTSSAVVISPGACSSPQTWRTVGGGGGGYLIWIGT